MKRYYIIAGALGVGLLVAGALLFGNSSSEEQGSTDTATTSTQSDTSNNTASDTPERNSSDNEAQSDDNLATYTTYSQKSFDQNTDKQRVLVFVDETDPTSEKLDNLLSSSRAQLPSDVVLYKTSMNKHKEMATLLGVTQPGIAIKFDSDGNLAGIYIAPESPDLSIFQTSLQLNEQAATPAETD